MLVATPLKKKVKIGESEYLIDKKIYKVEKIFSIISWIGYCSILIFFNSFLDSKMLPALLVVCGAIIVMQIVRFLILPQDIFKYLYLIEKGE